jgi:hypothetical protein
MVNFVEKHSPSNSESTLSQWLSRAIAVEDLQFKLHVRGNTLHLLCEMEQCPDRLLLQRRLLLALQQSDLNPLTPANFPQIYQIQLYGGQRGQRTPDWALTIYLNQLEEHLAQCQQQEAASDALHGDTASPSDTASLSQPAANPEPAALTVSNRSLARKGNPTAIASCLSETLSELGIAVRVSVKRISCAANSNVYSTDIIRPAAASKRLWIACEAPYQPDPSLVCEAVTQKLRELEIEHYRDAVILFQVAGETQPDWLLRVDLTPPSEMLREWARWGDVESLQRLLNQEIAPAGAQISTAFLKESTLHLICTVSASPADVAASADTISADPTSPAVTGVPDRQQIQEILLPLLDQIGPQGIHSATIYGQVADREAPAWVDWIELPAAVHPALSEPADALARQEDWSAVTFLLHRLLNPDLDHYLTTGGVRLQLMPKHDLLHIMSESAVCPDQHRVSQAIVPFVKQLNLPDIAGVRVYGRRAGQKQPIWNYGVDFADRQQMAPKATPDFAATDAYINELIAQPSHDVVRSGFAPDHRQTRRTFSDQFIDCLQQILVRSQLFVPSRDGVVGLSKSSEGYALAIVWGLVGALLVLQTNWLLENVLRKKLPVAGAEPAQTSTPTPPATVVSSTTQVESDLPLSMDGVRLPNSQDDAAAFDPKGFTTSEATADATATDLPHTPFSSEANLALAQSLAAEPFTLNFNSRQFNDKLQLYYRVLEESGPPDVLVVGSSRALRGVDPMALEQALAEIGHPNARVFNFGINGATAQVIDLLLRQLLSPDQLPRLVIWADGARAFNSKAVDVTYNGMIASSTYRDLSQGSLQLPHPSGGGEPSDGATTGTGVNITLTDSYQALDRWLSQQAADVAEIHQERDRLKHLIQRSATEWLAPNTTASDTSVTASGRTPLSRTALGLPADYELVDADGFLSLGVQFNPATYYQQYAKVPGDYDRDYLDFQIAGVQETALLTLLQYMQQQQVPVAFVNLPMTDEYLDATRTTYEQQFREHMVRLSAQQSGFTFHDLSQAWLTDYDYFSDPSHLNRYGAYAVSRRLAQNPRIAWPKALPVEGSR